MFALIVLLALAVLAAPVVAIAALISAGGLRRDIRLLEIRLEALESRPAAASATSASTTAPAASSPSPPVSSAVPEPVPPRPAAQPTAPTPKPIAAAAPPSSVPRSPAAPPPEPIGFEERFGTRWVVWVGGIALALGGIFLVRYSIEQGLIGPAVRVMLGALLALVLIVAGEWQRRSERLWAFPACLRRIFRAS